MKSRGSQTNVVCLNAVCRVDVEIMEHDILESQISVGNVAIVQALERQQDSLDDLPRKVELRLGDIGRSHEFGERRVVLVSKSLKSFLGEARNGNGDWRWGINFLLVVHFCETFLLLLSIASQSSRSLTSRSIVGIAIRK